MSNVDTCIGQNAVHLHETVRCEGDLKFEFMDNVSYKNYMGIVTCIWFHSPDIMVSQCRIILIMHPHDNFKRYVDLEAIIFKFIVFQSIYNATGVMAAWHRATFQWLKRYEGINTISCAVDASQDHRTRCLISLKDKGHGLQSFATIHLFYFSISTTCNYSQYYS